MFKKSFLSLVLLFLLPICLFAQAPAVNATVNGPSIVLTPVLPANAGGMWRITQGQNGIWYAILITAEGNKPAIYDYVVTITAGNIPIPPTPPTPPTPISIPTISTVSLPNGTVGTPYKQSIVVKDGSPPYSLSVSSLKLPAGLILNNNEISGIPTEAGTSNFGITVTDSKAQTATKSLFIVVEKKNEPEPPKPGPLFVLATYETADLNKLPPAQLNIINSPEIRKYLTEKCAKNTKGLPEYRFFDKDAKLDKESADWQQVWMRQNNVRKSLPWVTITNGTSTYDGPWTKDVKSMLELLKKYGG